MSRNLKNWKDLFKNKSSNFFTQKHKTITKSILLSVILPFSIGQSFATPTLTTIKSGLEYKRLSHEIEVKIKKTYPTPYKPIILISKESILKINGNYTLASTIEDQSRCGKLYVLNKSTKNITLLEFAIPNRANNSDSFLECKKSKITQTNIKTPITISFDTRQEDDSNIVTYHSLAFIKKGEICTSEDFSSTKLYPKSSKESKTENREDNSSKQIILDIEKNDNIYCSAIQ